MNRNIILIALMIILSSFMVTGFTIYGDLNVTGNATITGQFLCVNITHCYYIPDLNQSGGTVTQVNVLGPYLNPVTITSTGNVDVNESKFNATFLRLDGSVAMTGPLNMGTYNLNNVGDISAKEITATSLIAPLNYSYIQNFPNNCSANEYVFGLGTNLYCRADQDTTYTAGNGIQLVLNEFSTDANIAGANQYSYWDGSAWEVRNDIDTYNTTTQMRDAVNATIPYVIQTYWSNILNKFITAVDDVYIYMSGTTATLNETKLNSTINSIATDFNDSQKVYVDAQDIIYNDSQKIYIDAQDIVYNDSQKIYIDAQDILYNDSQKVYIDAQDLAYNNSQKIYIDAQDIVYNDSQKAWVIANYYTPTQIDGEYLRLDTTNNPLTGKLQVIVNDTNIDEDIINITNLNVNGVSSFRAQNDNGSSIQIGVFGSSISQEIFPGQVTAGQDALGVTGEGGPIWISAQGGHNILLGGTNDSNLSNSNFSITIDNDIQAIVLQGNKYIRPIRVDGGNAMVFQSLEVLVAGGFPFVWVAQDSSNETIVPYWIQNGNNNSFSGQMNTFGTVPKSWVSFTGQPIGDEMKGVEFLFNTSDYIKYCEWLQDNLSLVPEGCKYFADTIGRKVPLLFGGDGEFHRTLTVHEGALIYNDFDFINRNDNDFVLLWTEDNTDGSLHVRADKTLQANLTEFNQSITDFEDGTISPFVSESISPEAGRDWSNVDSYAECHQNLCSRALGGNTKIMAFTGDTTFSGGTIAAQNISLEFYYTTSGFNPGDNFSVTVDDNTGNVSTIFSTTTSDTDIFVQADFPTIFENKSNVTTRFNHIGLNINREVFVDNIRIYAIPESTIEINETYRGGRILVGDDDCYIENTRIINNATQLTESQIEISCTNIRLAGSVTEESTVIVSQNATGNIEAENLISRNDVNGSDFYDDGINLLTAINTKYDTVLSPMNDTGTTIGWIACPESYVWAYNSSVAGNWQCQPKTGTGGAGTVTSVSAGDGMDFTTITTSGAVDMGTPGTLSDTTSNAVTATSHTHNITIDKDLVAGTGLSGGEDDVFIGADADVTLTLEKLGDFTVSGTGMSGGGSNVLAGDDSFDTSVTLTTAKDLVAGNGLTGGENDVFPGADADTTITMGTPSSITDSSTNSVTSTSHTHTVDEASTGQRGIVQLTDSVSSTSTTTAATPNSVKTTYDLAVLKAATGDCGSGTVMQNITTSGVECIATSSGFTYSDYFDQGLNTTSTPQFAGMTTSGDIDPTTDETLDLGSIANSYNDIFATKYVSPDDANSYIQLDVAGGTYWYVNSINAIQLSSSVFAVNNGNNAAFDFRIDGSIDSLFTADSGEMEVGIGAAPTRTERLQVDGSTYTSGDMVVGTDVEVSAENKYCLNGATCSQYIWRNAAGKVQIVG